MSSNLTAIREISGILLKIRGGNLVRESCLKLCIVLAYLCSYRYLVGVYSVLNIKYMVSDHALLHSYPTTDSNTSAGMIWVTLNMPSAANRQRISHCVESGHCESSALACVCGCDSWVTLLEFCLIDLVMFRLSTASITRFLQYYLLSLYFQYSSVVLCVISACVYLLILLHTVFYKTRKLTFDNSSVKWAVLDEMFWGLPP